MPPIAIVTDSSAHFLDPHFAEQHGVTVLPLEVSLAGRVYREGVELTSEQFIQRAAAAREMPTLHPPPLEYIADIYDRLRRKTDRILSLHLSRTMHSTWQTAKAASETLLGRCEIAVMDSQSIATGLGQLVARAVRLVEELDSLDEVVRALRKQIPRIYSIFNVDQMPYLRRAGLLSESHAVLGGMLGIRPFLTIEEGELMAMEKVRTRSQAVDKLVEFVTEFADPEQVVILQHAAEPTEQTRALLERLAEEFAERAYPVLTYKPSLACFLGTEALGVMIYEGGPTDSDAHEDEGDFLT
jgi:DegV family protein with EDD domain